MGFSWQEYWSGLPFPPPVDHLSEFSIWPICLGWPCVAWLIASLSYASHFTTTRLWSMKREELVSPKGNQSWMFIGRTDAEAEVPILWPSDENNWLIGKDPDARKDWRWEDKWMKEVEIVGWHHLLDGHEFEYALEVGDGQGSLLCCSPWGHKELDTSEQLNCWLNKIDFPFLLSF